MQLSWDIRWDLLLWGDVHSVSWWLEVFCTKSCAAWEKPHHAWDKASAAKKKKKVQPRPQRDTASTITHSGNTSSAAAKQSRLSTQIITHLTSVSRLVKCVFSTRPATSVSPRLFGYTTPPRLSLLAFSQSFISPCSPAAGLLSHTVPPEIFIKVSLPGRLLGIHHGRVLQARTQKPPFASSHTPFIETLDEESHLFFLHPSIISSFSSHPSQI